MNIISIIVPLNSGRMGERASELANVDFHFGTMCAISITNSFPIDVNAVNESVVSGVAHLM